jgi:hypothetical protein
LDYDVLREFQIIDTRDVADVFVELEDEASYLANEYWRLMTDKEITSNEKRSRLRQVMAAMSHYMVQVHMNRLKANRSLPYSIRSRVGTFFSWTA